jgi:hypothetical protein
MTEVTYLSAVECQVLVQDGLLNTQVVGVKDGEGTVHVLRVGKGSLQDQGEKLYLPVGLIKVDRSAKQALVELPQEADSGTSRIWLPFTSFRRQGQ